MLVYFLLKLTLLFSSILYVLLDRFEPSTDNIKIQACEVYGINKMGAKNHHVCM